MFVMVVSITPVSCLAIFYHTIPYLTLSYLALPCLAVPSLVPFPCT